MESSLDERLDRTTAKTDRLKKLGYNLKIIWECEFKEYLKQNPELDTHLNDNPMLMFNGINPRDAIYGGRTEVFKLYYKVKANEKIRYLDFCSLYPAVNLRGKYPLGHPKEILTGKKECDRIENLDTVDGIIKCIVLPPQDLIIPVLPVRVRGKLYFSLCRTCTELESVQKCVHDEQKRALVGTWVISEVQLALRYGYKILHKIEMWTYETCVYNPTSKTGGIFTEYMKTFLKLKQEASGWPSDCTTPEKKKEYIQMYREKEGIELNDENINVNPSYRNLAKLCANSLWGKLSQRPSHSETTCVESPMQLYAMATSPAITINDLYLVGEDKIWVNWKYTNDEFQTPARNVSVTTGAFTTTHARIMLFNELIQLGNEILYCDTDSIIYVEKEGSKYKPDLGPCIGQLTDELEVFGVGAFIESFTSIGPKSYAFRVKVPNKSGYIEVAKCKGFSASGENKNILNFKNFQKMVCGNDYTEEDSDSDDNITKDEFITTFTPKKIKRAKGFRIISEPEKKKFGFTFTKRICVGNDYDTIPYGYNSTTQV